MKKTLTTLILCSFAFGLGFGFNSIAFSDNEGLKVAYVDVPKLLDASKTLKTAQQTKVKQTEEMLKWYDKCSGEIQKQTTKEAKESLIKKYETQLTSKKNSIKDTYAKKLNEVDSQLDKAITEKSKELGYDLVFRKESILLGGDDITSQILPLVK